MPAARIEARLLLRGEALLGPAGLAGLGAALLACSLPWAPLLLAIPAVASAWNMHATASAIGGRTLCWDGRWYWDGEPQADGGCTEHRECPTEPLPVVEHTRISLGVLLLGFSGPSARGRLVIILPLLDRESRRCLQLACRAGGSDTHGVTGLDASEMSVR